MKKIVGIVLIVLVLVGVALGIGEIADEIFDYDNGRLTYELGSAKSSKKYEAATAKEVKSETDDIGKEKAKEIALQNAGVTADQVVWEKVERDYDDGRLEYQVEFHVGNKEYDYEIDGKTGNILERDFDLEDDRWDY